MNGTDQPNSPDESKITSGSSRAMAPETPENRAFLFKVLDLVDRYWNGSKSLHKHAKFKGQDLIYCMCVITTQACQVQR